MNNNMYQAASHAVTHQNVIDNYNENFNNNNNHNYNTITATNNITTYPNYPLASAATAAIATPTAPMIPSTNTTAPYHSSSISHMNDDINTNNIMMNYTTRNNSNSNSSRSNTNEIIYIDTDSTDEPNNLKKRKLDGLHD